jgi:hypothetical protein
MRERSLLGRVSLFDFSRKRARRFRALLPLRPPPFASYYFIRPFRGVHSRAISRFSLLAPRSLAHPAAALLISRKMPACPSQAHCLRDAVSCATAAKTESPSRGCRHRPFHPPCPNIAAVYRNFTLRECTSRPLRARFAGDEASIARPPALPHPASPRAGYRNFSRGLYSILIACD